MRTRQASRVALAAMSGMTAVLLIAGFGCVPPTPDNHEGITDGIRDPNGVTVTIPADPSGMDPNQPTHVPDGSMQDDTGMDPNAPFQADGDEHEAENWLGACTTSFKHVQPGVMSEFYVDCTTGPGPGGMDPNEPGPLLSLDVQGPGVMRNGLQAQPFQPNHPFHFIVPINRFGTYDATVEVVHDGMTVASAKASGDVK